MPSVAESAAIVVIGDEILSGKFADENAAYAIKVLRARGVGLRRIETVADVLDDIADAVTRCAARADHVLTSGGVGPTHDDLTMEGIARAFGVGVHRHPELERLLRAFYGDKLDDRNLRMADVPVGAELVAADHPAWPVTRMRNVYILPGIPLIFRRKLDAILPNFTAGAFHVRRVYAMADEAQLAAHMDAVVGAHALVQVGSYPRIEALDFRVLITLESRDPDAVVRAVDDLVARLGALVVRVE